MSLDSVSEFDPSANNILTESAIDKINAEAAESKEKHRIASDEVQELELRKSLAKHFRSAIS